MKTLASVLLLGCLLAAPAVAASRGYVTTPAELREIARKAGAGKQPYKNAVHAIVRYASSASEGGQGAEDPHFWPLGSIGGEQSCPGTFQPRFLADGSPLVEAKAMAYHLTGNAGYAAEIRKRLLELSTTSGYGGRKWSQCVPNLNWYVAGWIIAADLIEDFPGWSASDKKTFQRWLAAEVYYKSDAASDFRSNNHGSAGSAAAAMISDYLAGSGIALVDRDGKSSTPPEAFAEAKRHQLDRMNGNAYMRHEPGCPPEFTLTGIRPDGGIPWELARGSTGCGGKWIEKQDASWTYQQTHLQGTLLHAELLLRRGDKSIYDNVKQDGGGSLRRAVLFVLHNPNAPSKSYPLHRSHFPMLELAYRYYRDPAMARELGIGTGHRKIGSRSGQMLHFGTITHGFSPDETPAPPPVTALP